VNCDSLLGLSSTAIETVPESSVSAVEERIQEDPWRWWKMGMKIISNDKSFYKNFETRDILWRFLNPWYLTEVLKLMIFNRSSERLFLMFKKYPRNMFLIDGLVRETATIGK